MKNTWLIIDIDQFKETEFAAHFVRELKTIGFDMKFYSIFANIEMKGKKEFLNKSLFIERVYP